MGKKWVPSNYVDEVTPPPRETPSDWLVGGNALADIEDDEPPHPLADGQIVRFDWVEDLGRSTIIIREDGSYDAEVPPVIPEGGTFHVYDGCDPETLAFDMPSFIESLREEGPGRYDAVFYSWSWRGVPFRFHAGKFARVEPDEREG